MVDRQFRSLGTTTLATLRCTNTSPGSRPVIWLAGTRLSEQPIHMYLGFCCASSPVKNPGRSRSIRSAHSRLWTNRSSMEVVLMRCSLAAGVSPMVGRAGRGRSAGLREQFAADQHAADFTGTRADFVEFRISPQAAQRVLVDIPIAAMDLQPLAGHPGRFLRAPQDHRGAVLAHLAHVIGTQ